MRADACNVRLHIEKVQIAARLVLGEADGGAQTIPDFGQR